MSIFDLFDDKLREAMASGETPTKIYVDNITFGDVLQILEEQTVHKYAVPSRGFQDIAYVGPSGQVQVVRSKHKFKDHRVVSVNYDIDDWLDRQAERILLLGEEDEQDPVYWGSTSEDY